MAEAIVKLRALYLSRDFDTYWNFHVTQDQQRIYPPGALDFGRKVATPLGDRFELAIRAKPTSATASEGP